MNAGSVAAGFECPRCGWRLAVVERIALPQVELLCYLCHHRWAVEV